MRISALRVWFANAVRDSSAYARRVGTMIGRKLRDATGMIDRGVGVGDDESEFGGGRSRAFIQEIIDDAKKKLLALFEKSFFERFPRFQRHMRRLLGTTVPVVAKPLPRGPGPNVKLGAHSPPTNEEALAFRRQIERRMLEAHQKEHAGLRDTMEQRRRKDPDEDQV